MSLVTSNVLLTRDLCHQKSARKTDFTRSRRDGGDYEPVNQVASIRGLHTHGEGLSPPLSLVTFPSSLIPWISLHSLGPRVPQDRLEVVASIPVRWRLH